MPIRGLTDRGAAFPQIGRIHKGAKKPEGGKKPGKDLDYFRIEFDEDEMEAAARCKELYGDEPDELKIMLPLRRIESVWDAWIEAYTAGGLVYRGNGNGPAQIKEGEFGVIFWRDPMTGETLVRNGLALRDLALPDGTEAKAGQPVPCVASMGYPVGQYEDADGQARDLLANPNGRLKVILSGLGRFAYLLFTTTSQHDIGNLSGQLEAMQDLQRAAGVSGIPLIMRRRPRMVSVPLKQGNRIRRQRMEKYLVSIEADPEWAAMKTQAMMEAATPEILEGSFIEVPALPPPEEGAEGEPPDGDELEQEEDRERAAEASQREAARNTASPPAKEKPAAAEAPTKSGPKPKPERTPAGAPEPSFAVATLDAVVKEGLAADRKEAAGILALSPWRDPGKAIKKGEVMAWVRAFKRGLAENLEPAAAAEAATAEVAELAGG